MRRLAFVGLLWLASCRYGFASLEDAPDAAGPDVDARVDALVGGDASTRNLVFHTSTALAPAALVARGSGDVLQGGDSLCAERAAAGGLPGSYVALLSTPVTPAIDRLAGARGWYRLDGLPFADSATSMFTARQVFYPVLFDELGVASPTVQVMTGTAANGLSGDDCLDWTSSAVANTVLSGNTTDGSGGWSSRYIPGCNAQGLHIYCFGIDHDTPLDMTPEPGRRAFVSLPWTPAGGVAGADAHCQQNAVASSVPGTYRALLATNTASAASRMTAGAGWVRLDGVRLAATAADLQQGKAIAALTLRADGITHVSGVVWSGAGSINAVSASQSCVNWTSASSASSGRQAVASSGGETFFTEPYTGACNTAAPLYCLEQ